MIDIKEFEHATDTPIWKWLRQLIKTLGEDGTSSDESDDEHAADTHPVTYYFTSSDQVASTDKAKHCITSRTFKPTHLVTKPDEHLTLRKPTAQAFTQD